MEEQKTYPFVVVIQYKGQTNVRRMGAGNWKQAEWFYDLLLQESGQEAFDRLVIEKDGSIIHPHTGKEIGT